MKSSKLLSAAALLLCCSLPALALGPGASDAGTAPAPPKALHSFDLNSIDKSANPCTNFYQYACGDWVKNNPIPGDQVRWGTFNQLAERNEYLLYKELKQAADSPENPRQKRYGTFFAACMNVQQANALGDTPIRPSLHAIDAMSNKAQIADFLGDKRYIGGGFFQFSATQDEKDSSKQIAVLHQGGLSLPDRDYYLLQDPRMTKIRDQFQAYAVNIFKLIGDDQAKAEAEAKSVMSIETALAKGSMSRVEERNPNNIYHPMSISNLKQLAPDFVWDQYFAGVKPPPFTTLNVAQPDFFRTMATVIQNEPLDAIKSYLRFHTVDDVAEYLSEPFDQASFDFFHKTLNGQAQEQPRWKRCTELTDRQLGEAVGQEWVKQNFPPQDKASMQKLVNNLEASLGQELQQQPWMSPETKKKAEEKLAAYRDKIGYPEHWRSYAGVEVTPANFIEDLHNASVFNYDWQIGHINKPVNEQEWGMTPSTVNAYYDPSMNDINFPAGILQPPFYSQSIDPAVNYGAIGVVIGHEMTHGFDDEGSQFDAHGNLKDWFTAEDRAKFDKMTSCEVNEYGNFEPVPGLKLNGKLTLGENTADNGGMRVAYRALQTVLDKEPADERDKKIEGYTPDQRFFIAFAQVWCGDIKDAAERVRVRTDPHSPGEFRTNGTVQNFAAFGKAFDCHVGQPMMPANACHVW